jgi:hypothetical protein
MAAETAFGRQRRLPQALRFAVAVAMLLCLLTLVAACGGSKSTNAQSSNLTTPATSGQKSPTTVVGNWRGTWKSTLFQGATGTFQMRLAQSGARLSGPITVQKSACISTGTDNGTVSGDKISFGAVNGNQTISYVGTVKGDTMSGTYSAPDCSNDKGSWTATRSG